MLITRADTWHPWSRPAYGTPVYNTRRGYWEPYIPPRTWREWAAWKARQHRTAKRRQMRRAAKRR